MINQIYSGTPTQSRFAKCPSSIVGGQPVLIGKEPAVALNAYSSLTGGATFYTGGTFALDVLASSAVSPISGVTVKPGDKIYADGGSTDSATNITSGFQLDVNSSGTVLFGYLDPSATALVSGTDNPQAPVRLQGAE